MQKQSGQNSVTVAEQVKARLAGLTAALPADVSASVNNDQSIFIRAAISSLEEHLVLGSILASIVVFFFPGQLAHDAHCRRRHPNVDHLDLRVDGAMGYTLNQMTMLG